MTNANLWSGKIVSDSEFKILFDSHLNNSVFWAKPPLSHYLLFSAVQEIQEELLKKGSFYEKLRNDLLEREDIISDEVDISMNGLIDFLNVDQLRIKLKRELGSEHPFELKRHKCKS